MENIVEMDVSLLLEDLRHITQNLKEAAKAQGDEEFIIAAMNLGCALNHVCQMVKLIEEQIEEEEECESCH